MVLQHDATNLGFLGQRLSLIAQPLAWLIVPLHTNLFSLRFRGAGFTRRSKRKLLKLSPLESLPSMV